MVINLKTPEEIALMREAGRIVARAHEAMREALREGITTLELDKIAEEVIRSSGATPVFLNYPKHNAPNFPATITASINSELIHGIPSDKRVLKAGDVVSLDTGCKYQGFVGDAARTWIVGEGTPATRRLVEVTQQAFFEALKVCKVGYATRDIARAVQSYVEKHGYSITRDYTGHGVGREMHEEPEIPNWWHNKLNNRQNASVPLQVGMTFAIEPMVMSGRAETKELADKWTVASRDGGLCAHYEHTVAITDSEPLILTEV